MACRCPPVQPVTGQGRAVAAVVVLLLLVAGHVGAEEVYGFACPTDNPPVTLNPPADLSQYAVPGTTYFPEAGEYTVSRRIEPSGPICYIGRGGSSAVVVKSTTGSNGMLYLFGLGLNPPLAMGLKGITLDGHPALQTYSRAITIDFDSQFYADDLVIQNFSLAINGGLGAGMYIVGSGVQIKMRGVKFLSNKAGTSGAGIHCDSDGSVQEIMIEEVGQLLPCADVLLWVTGPEAPSGVGGRIFLQDA